MSPLSCGQTVPLWYSIGLYAGCPSASVRTPQPENSRSPSRCPTIASTCASGTIPLHSRCPMFEVSVGTSRPSPRVVGVALHLAYGARQRGERPVGVDDRVPGVLPAVVLQPRPRVAGGVLEEAVAVGVAVLLDPLQ